MKVVVAVCKSGEPSPSMSAWLEPGLRWADRGGRGGYERGGCPLWTGIHHGLPLGGQDRQGRHTDKAQERLAQLTSFLLTLPGVSLPTPPGTEPSLISEPYLSFVAASASTVRSCPSAFRRPRERPRWCRFESSLCTFVLLSRTDTLWVRLQQHPTGHLVGLGEAA